MKNQWTTVPENSTPKKGDISHEKTVEKRNKKVAIAMASIGIFFILVGIAPFIFDGSDSKDYSAFLTKNAVNSIDTDVTFQPEPTTISFDDGDEFVAEPVVAQEILTQPTEEVSPSEEAPVVAKEKPISADINIPNPQPIPVDTSLQQAENATAPQQEEGNILQQDFSNPAIVSDAAYAPAVTEGTFPPNSHTGSQAAPVIFPEKNESEGEMHSAATPAPGKEGQKNPSTGLPVLPLLVFSAGAALFARFRKYRTA